MSLQEMKKNLIAIEAICDNEQIDSENARGMASMIALILKNEIDKLIKEKEC